MIQNFQQYIKKKEIEMHKRNWQHGSCRLRQPEV